MTMERTASCAAAFAVYLVCIGLLYPISAQNPATIVARPTKHEIGKVAEVSCVVNLEKAAITWTFKDKPVKETKRIVIKSSTGKGEKDIDGTTLNSSISTIEIINSTAIDHGNYTCEVKEHNITAVSLLDLSFPAKWIEGKTKFDVNVSDSAAVGASCEFDAFNCTTVVWYKQDGGGGVNTLVPSVVNATRVKVEFNIPIHRPEDNGTYICEIDDAVSNKKVQGHIDVWVKALPKVIIDKAMGISTTQIYLNWTVFAYNSEITNYHLHYRNNTSTSMLYTAGRIHPKNTSFVMKGLQKATMYDLVLEVVTAFGARKSELFKDVSTLDFDPNFVPNISINGFSATSVTIGWTAPDEKEAKYIHYYLLEATKKDVKNVSRTAYHSQNMHNLPYMFDYLEPHSTYIFKVKACSEYTGQCGNWSKDMEAATLDGNPTKPTNFHTNCSSTFIKLTWGLPERPNAEIKGYTMELTGNAQFRDRYGKEKQVTWGPLSKFTKNEATSVRIDDLQPNTNYTVRLSAMTRTRRRGEEASASCSTLPAPPDQPPRPRWRKILQDDKYMFKMFLPRISERNGHLCCYRVYMVRLQPQWDWRSLPAPKDIQVLDHKDAHGPTPVTGAYITDIFSNDNFPFDSELVMGDEKSQYNKSEPVFSDSVCSRCREKPERKEPTTTTTTTTTTTLPTTMLDEDYSTDDPVDREKRSYDNDKNFGNDATMADKKSQTEREWIPYDGPLDARANYTLFVELITKIENEASMYSDYVNVLMPAPTPPTLQPHSTFEVALQATCALSAVVLLLMIVFCIRQARQSRKMPPHAPLEMNSLQAAFRNMFRGRAQYVPPTPPDMDPIPKEDLARAYAERQADSDYGFQKEFEMLPECFPDRTTHSSEARENQSKNRYPDIKAYDQTRVKLSQIYDVAGSDYINANFVMGYQERKQFICAQGPTETTVNDFWRMIWEHGLELIVMLTNLEEYSKVKCSKYWPDEGRGSRVFGGLTVHHVTEKRYSDYIVRELKITKQPLNSEGQPIVENNGIAKRNGDCREASESSAPTSPRELKEECRVVKQYHFLMWKDFAAPEHAYSILRFIKRVNEEWGGMVSRACVVHCSAGVGRTGTLVALDCLLEQLRDVGHAAVFNTVAELRRARNFLVQSLKQYVFVYRALVEYAHYGDTEIPAHKLKSSIDGLRNTPPAVSTCLMEIEFEKILNSPIPEPLKSCAAGAADELRAKNRNVEILPYDRNRVILAPIPARDYSTYINASFIEAYDNSEGFIITQDPMPSTIVDFWRMVSEHNVTTIVMLSELGDGKCPRYWEDGSSQHDHITVQYEESESCPYYTHRQFRVLNNKSGCSSCVRQLQYQGWPTAPGSVPEVTRGLAELADAAAPSSADGVMLVHCQLGTERSSLFVALCILICQLRTERRVDVCCVARKLRSQRTRTINAFLQYEFLHRAILNYAELHNLLEDS